MPKEEIMEHLKTYFAKEVLGNKDIGLDEHTPLLEWGIINSLEIVRLLSFIQKQFSVEIPNDKLVADYFTDISAIADMILDSVSAYRN